MDTFVRLCEDHLAVKPSVVRHSCRLLGKPSADRPRKLLIRLHSESAAQSLLKAARERRTCDNASVAANVYINADLSPAEAKIAFEKRQRKRERAQRMLVVAVVNVAVAISNILTSMLTAPNHNTNIWEALTAMLKVRLSLLSTAPVLPARI